MTGEDLIQAITRIEAKASPREKCNMPALTVPAEILLKFMRSMHDDPQLSFDMLCTHTAVDWLSENRFELLYVLYSTKYGHYVTISTSVPRENPEASSVSSIWRVAEWQEREAYDLMGILYSGHPDLRRIFLEDDWQGFPLRKDYKDDFMLKLPE
jgi:NADH-quinone oxidoreductase subunit C